MIVLIDNGHGSDTAGKGSPYSLHKVSPEIPLKEYEWARDIARDIVFKLRQHGFSAKLLVPEKQDISLTERCKRVNVLCKDNDCILISIHLNASGDGHKWMSAQGWSAYTSIGKTKADNLSQYLYTAAEEYFSDRKIRKYSPVDPDFEDNFMLLKKTLCPAVITENFFMDNISDAMFIVSPEGKRKIVDMHVKGITNYIKSLR